MKFTVSLATVAFIASALIHIWLWAVTPSVLPTPDTRDVTSALYKADLTIAYLTGFVMGQCQAACILHTNDTDACTAQFPHTTIPPVPSDGTPLPYGEPCVQYMRPVLPSH